MQVIDERPKGRAVTAVDYTRTGRLLTELAKRVHDAGVTLVYHHQHEQHRRKAAGDCGGARGG
jgi:hypothetical protein